MDSTQRTRSPHVKLQEFMDCYLETEYDKELKNFSQPKVMGSIREEAPDEALRYFALVLLYAMEERVEDISFTRKSAYRWLCSMTGEKTYEVPPAEAEVMSAMFEEIKEMVGIDETKRKGKLILGLKNDQLDLTITSSATPSGEESIVVHLPPLA